MKKTFILIALVAAFIAIVGIFTSKVQKNEINVGLFQKPPTNQKEVKIANTKILVEVASTDAARQKGLSDRKSLDSNSGMLFVFETNSSTKSFWMKGMEFPLDFMWIKDGKIIQIDKNIEAPSAGTEDTKLTIYTSKEPVDYVLEVNAGFSDKNNIQVGDSVDLSKI